jgi:hypothetical protein
MGDNPNWYRQLLALLLLSTSRAAVEYLTNPASRQEIGQQMRDALQQIDYDAAAKALTRAIDDVAAASKEKLDGAIDSLRDLSVEAVDEGKKRAEKQAGKKKGGKLRFFIGLAIGAVIAYFLIDEQRRDDLLDRLTGASGPIEQATQSAAQHVTSTAQQTVNQAQQTTESASSSMQSAADQAEQVARDASQSTGDSKP